MSERVGIAILGAGIFAKEAHLPAIQAAGDKVVLRAVYSRSEGSAGTFAAFAQSTLNIDVPFYHDGGDPTKSLDSLLAREDIAAVIVVLPINTQPEIIVKALKAGKHVLSEKPVARDVASALKLIKTYEEEYKPKGLIWRVAENFEVEPGYLFAKKVIADGEIGKLQYFNLSLVAFVDESSKWYQTPWRTKPEYQGGFLLDGGVHFTALLRTILPSPITEVSAFASLNKAILAPHDTINAILRCADGTHGIWELSFGSPSSTRGALNATSITGTEGWIQIGNTQKDGKTHIKVDVHKGDETKTTVLPSCGVEKELEHFLELLGGRDEGFGEPRSVLKDVAFIEAALNSEGNLIKL
ncbi:hypothetical protein BOTBODRAFT_60302 [Botryobasidium botryosum FD-172 SS1]|uniref:Gfo/Idh/MocA-like oxidoreductase N-terminal domain-containing protein n=1 Tax=Botryobasidium botryosum (strain FD-172 SS1) TaxID=930990 RepID=A0A067LV16_BOTB1|nr:hypothetical protein BOTBODRAFT_60302 [Botryobasidium botryosum FD-172 SS1]